MSRDLTRKLRGKVDLRVGVGVGVGEFTLWVAPRGSSWFWFGVGGGHSAARAKFASADGETLTGSWCLSNIMGDYI